MNIEQAFDTWFSQQNPYHDGEFEQAKEVADKVAFKAGWEAQRKQVDKILQALRVYANKDNYDLYNCGNEATKIKGNHYKINKLGTIAKQALEEYGDPENLITGDTKIVLFHY